MSNNVLYIKGNIIKGSIIAVLLFTLLTMMSSTTWAYNQDLQSTRSHTVTSFANVPASGAGPAATADLQWDQQTKTLTATVYVSGLRPGSSYANHIHVGDCSMVGKLLYPFNNIVTDATGSGTTTTTINNIADGIPASGWDVMIHNGPTAAASSLLCGNVVNLKGATELTIPLNLVEPMS